MTTAISRLFPALPLLCSVFFLAGAPIASAQGTQSSSVQSQKSAPSLYVYDFYADWCHNCSALEPYLQSVGKKYGSSVRFVRVDIDAPENRSLVTKAAIQAVPTILVSDRAGKPPARLLGGQEARNLDRVINSYLFSTASSVPAAGRQL